MSLAITKALIDKYEKEILDLKEQIERLKSALEKINLTTEPYSYAVAEEALKELEG